MRRTACPGYNDIIPVFVYQQFTTNGVVVVAADDDGRARRAAQCRQPAASRIMVRRHGPAVPATHGVAGAGARARASAIDSMCLCGPRSHCALTSPIARRLL